MKASLNLIEPVEYGDETITTLQFNKLRGKHLRRFTVESLSDPSFDQLLDLAADLSTQPPELIDRLGPADCFAVINLVSSFLFQLTPAKSTTSLSS